MCEMLELVRRARHHSQVCVCVSMRECECEGTQTKGHTAGVTSRNTQHFFGTAVLE